MKRQPNTKRRSSKYLTREQAKAILDFLESPELPEHDSPFKLYLDGKLIASAGMSKPNAPSKPNLDESN